jgi:hypothetical protein
MIGAVIAQPEVELVPPMALKRKETEVVVFALVRSRGKSVALPAVVAARA